MPVLEIDAPWGVVNYNAREDETDQEIESNLLKKYTRLQDLSIARAKGDESAAQEIATLRGELNIPDSAIQKALTPVETDQAGGIEARVSAEMQRGETLPYGRIPTTGLNPAAALRGGYQGLLDVGGGALGLLGDAGLLDQQTIKDLEYTKALERERTRAITQGSEGSGLVGELAGATLPFAAATPTTAAGIAGTGFLGGAIGGRAYDLNPLATGAIGAAIPLSLQKLGAAIGRRFADKASREKAITELLESGTSADSRILGYSLADADKEGFKRLVFNPKLAKIADNLADYGVSPSTSANIQAANKSTKQAMGEMVDIMKKGATDQLYATNNPIGSVIGKEVEKQIGHVVKAREKVGKALGDIVDFDLPKIKIDASDIKTDLESALANRFGVSVPEEAAARVGARSQKLQNEIASIADKYGVDFNPAARFNPEAIKGISPRDMDRLTTAYSQWRALPAKTRQSGTPTLDFTDSSLSTSPEAQKSIKDLYKKLSSIDDIANAPAKSLHELKRTIDNNIRVAKLSDSGLDSEAERLLLDVRTKINKAIGAKHGGYKKVNSDYSELTDSLNGFDRFIKRSDIEALRNTASELSADKYGKLLRRELGQAVSREDVIAARKALTETANKFGGKFDIELDRLNDFAARMEVLMPQLKPTSFLGQSAAAQQAGGKALGHGVAMAANLGIGNKLGAGHAVYRMLEAVRKGRMSMEQVDLDRAEWIRKFLTETGQ